MIRLFRNIIIVLTLALLFCKCSSSGKENESFVQANLILDSINALDSADLVKIHRRGFVGNCLPAETFSKLLKFDSSLKKLGYYTEWNYTKHSYSIVKIGSD